MKNSNDINNKNDEINISSNEENDFIKTLNKWNIFRYKQIIIGIIILIIIGYFLGEKYIFSENSRYIASEKIVNEKMDSSLQDILIGKYIIHESKSNDNIIMYFKKDRIINCSDGEEYPTDNILGIKYDNNKLVYELESTYYDELIYHNYTIEIIDENTVRCIYEDGSTSKEYKLLSKEELVKEMYVIYEDKEEVYNLLNTFKYCLEMDKENIDSILK